MATSAWRRVVELQSQKLVFVNTETGECSWNSPDEETPIESKSTDWWEFVDPKSSRHYYYNQASGKKRWRRPKKGDIVFMAKVQDPSSTALPELSQSKPPPPAKPAPFSKSPEPIRASAEVEKTKVSSSTDPDAPIWLDDWKYDLCLIQADESPFADHLATYFDEFAVRYVRHTPKTLVSLRVRYDDYNDEEDPDPAQTALESRLRGAKFFMFVFSSHFVDTPSDYETHVGDSVVLSHFPPDDPIHDALDLVNLLPIMDGTTQDDLKGYSPSIGSKIPIKSSIGAKRLSEMFFKKLTGQMPNENFRLIKYMKEKEKKKQ